jgi:hypothetical protein
VITRAYDCYLGDEDRAWPRKVGFCHFSVPYFESPGALRACTLYYHQKSHSGSANLLVNMPPIVSWPGADSAVYWLIWNCTDTAATDITHTTDGWYKVPLTTDACAAIRDAAGDVFVTGWVYCDSVDGTYTEVDGDGDYEPYIKVWYNAP